MSALTDRAAKIFAKDMLQNPGRYEWSLQGMGMLRTYLPDWCRLQVWDTRHAFPGVSVIHDHPWHFDSLVLGGIVRNYRYKIESVPIIRATHMVRTIQPGVGLKVLAEDSPVYLADAGTDVVYAGQVYQQRADEIHASNPEIGTVTLIQRERVGADVARTFYPIGSEWGTAEPRPATRAEIKTITEYALRRWFA